MSTARIGITLSRVTMTVIKNHAKSFKTRKLMKHGIVNKAYLKSLLFRIKEKIAEKWNRKSFRYGIAFFALIPIFAVIYYILPTNCWNTESNAFLSFWHSIYFSIVTITTLGFGDIYPNTTCSRIFVSLESIGGVIFIGLFLNALSSEQAKKVSELEEKRHNDDLFEIERNKLNLQRKMLETRINRYLLSAYCLITPIEKRNFTNIKISIDEINFNDMYDMFGQTLLLTQNLKTSSLEMFLQTQDELFEEMSDLLKMVNVGCWTDLLIPINNFMLHCVEFNYKDSLLGVKHMSFQGKAATDYYSEFIKNYHEELRFKPSNSANQFIALFNLVIKNLKEIERIQNALSFIFRQEDLNCQSEDNAPL